MRTFIVMRACMELGGIETYMYRMIRWMLAHNGRVIFIALKGITYADSFCDTIVNHCEIHNADIHDPLWLRHLNLTFAENEEVIAYTFSLYQYAMMERLRRKYARTTIHSFLWVPNYHGSRIFPELEVPSLFKNVVKKRIGSIYAHMDINNNIVYINPSHRDALTRNYNYTSADYRTQIIRILGDPKPLDLPDLYERAKRKTFTIVTVSRFVFPQKGYLFGLIEAFGILAKRYEQLFLIIIGDGVEAERASVEAAIQYAVGSGNGRICTI